jgi:lauroyl/myristoyl acyltransferase
MNELLSPLTLRWKRWFVVPPALPTPYGISDFVNFFREETWSFSPAYARKNLELRGVEELMSLQKTQAVVICFLHHGSFMLMGGGFRHQLGLPYSAVVSTRNIDPESEEERFWVGVHQRLQSLYESPLFYTHEPVTGILKWLKIPGNLFGIVLDVRERHIPHKEERFSFMGRQIFMQTGPARLARLARVPMVPCVTWYEVASRKHIVQMLPAITTILDDPIDVTQRALALIEPYIMKYPEQQFYDIASALEIPHAYSRSRT